ncbi:MAG: hypothetical protein JOZ62_00300 [Acidobacteriaceae bacterium]|nr:hypothetical protein [Acidobacteriaceae bacterium]
MGLILTYGTRARAPERLVQQQIASEARLNLLALDYGYRYRVDISAKNAFSKVEFVRTLREARFIGMPARRSGRLVRFFKMNPDGTLKRHQW